MSRDRAIRDLERRAQATHLPADIAALHHALARSGRPVAPRMLALGFAHELAETALNELKALVEEMPWPLPYKPGAPVPPLANKWPMNVRASKVTAIGIDATSRRMSARVVVIAETESTGHLRAGVAILGQPKSFRRLPQVRKGPVAGFEVNVPRRFPIYARRALGLIPTIPERLRSHVHRFIYDLEHAPTVLIRRPERKPGDIAGWSYQTHLERLAAAAQ